MPRSGREGQDPRRLDPVRLPSWPRPADPAAELDWSDPLMSRRLLREHLDQEHDGASRRIVEIDRHIARLSRLLPGPPSRILDAACGPGLYSVRLAGLGHDVVGTDVGPAVLAHARAIARDAGVAAATRFGRWDLTEPPPAALVPDAGFDGVLLLYWVLEAFRRPMQAAILRRLRAAVRPGGLVVAEVRVRPDQPPGRVSHWERVPWSLLGDRSHLLLTDTTWDDRRRIYVLREVAVLDDGSIAAQQTTGFLTTLEEARRLFDAAGLRVRAVYDGWSRFLATGLSESLVVVAERPRALRSAGLERPAPEGHGEGHGGEVANGEGGRVPA